MRRQPGLDRFRITPLFLSVVFLAMLQVEGAAATQRTWLGVTVCKRLVIRKIFPGSPAEAAGLKAEDRIIAVAGEGNVVDIRDELRDLEPGDPVIIRFQRSGAAQEVVAIVGPARDEEVSRGTTVHLPALSHVAVPPGDPLANPECKEKCAAMVPTCADILLEGQGGKRTIGRWKGRLVLFEEDLRGNTFSDEKECKEAVEHSCVRL
jgi:hypothetical protein